MGKAAAQVMDEEQVEVVKVTPYPFDLNLEAPSGAVKASVLKLVIHGMIVDVSGSVLKVGDQYSGRFELPAGIGLIQSSVKVVKTYDRQVPGKEGPIVQRLAEIHFLKPLRDHEKERVKTFLKRIQQTGADLV